jgi:hypothetical protein
MTGPQSASDDPCRSVATGSEETVRLAVRVAVVRQQEREGARAAARQIDRLFDEERPLLQALPDE